ncbi:class I SAM-dependent DNA methyltransferase [Allorhizocola rhizosphaerae]|uniref:class I SAM-dependent DNA methyltransferase n=1 Tax=Allorhizocola rhizosphaerae TaxID=1872709 RepID=UPI0013C2CD61|nr:class I SAM-dependent methyltransferase [Allorhizocola rhizosphaerae]
MSRAFDVIGEHYSEVFAEKPGQVEAGRWLIEHLRGEWVVLDVGCGTGVPTARQLADAGCTVVGVDSSPVMLEIARRNVPNAILFEREMHDLQGLHPRQGRFDGAAAFFSLLMLDRVGVGKALDAIRGVLAAGAVLVIGMVEGDTDYLMRDFLGVPVPLTAYPRSELRDLLSRHGFTVDTLIAEPSVRSTPDTPQQTHLYARCFVTPTM